MKKINVSVLYIGNDLTKKTNYLTTMDTLTSLLKSENYTIFKSSNKLNKIYRLFDMCFSVIKYSRKVDYILIDTFSTSNFYYALLTSQLSRILKIKFIPILHGGNLPYRLDSSPKLSSMIFKNSFVNVAPSNYLKTEFEKRGYVTDFVPNILEIENYEYVKRKNLSPKILWVRAFKELYNPTMAIRVLNLLKKKFNNAELCMVGPSKDASFEKTKELARKLGILDSVTFTGVLSKSEWHKKSKEYDIFINTTNFDNTPVSVMEAMALGLTIVSTNAGGMPYLIENGKEGIIVEKNDYDSMARVIIDLINTNDQTFSKNARNKAETFGWNVVRQKWKSILV